MDYVTRQFINLTKKFRKLLELLRKDIQEHTKAIRAQSKRDKDRHNQLPIPVQLKFEEDEITERQTQNLRQNAIQDSTRRATWFTFIAASIYAAITLGIWFEMNIQNINQSTANINSGATADRTLGQVQRTVNDTHELAVQAARQAKAAEDSARANQDSVKALRAQFQMEQRPYVSILSYTSFEPTPKITTIPPAEAKEPAIGHHLAVQINFKNAGKSPAVNFLADARILVGVHAAEVLPIPQPVGIGPQFDVAAEGSSVAFLVDDPSTQGAEFQPKHWIDWDGTEPIILYGRISYEDFSGNRYCTPFATQYINAAWGHLPGFKSPSGFSISELCPKGTI